MEYVDATDFFKWLEKSNFTESDIIHCRKMQYFNIVESENVYGISGVSVCGFINSDVVKMGNEIKQHYSESKKDYYERVYRIMCVCANLMDSVNEILKDEGSWGIDYFHKKFKEWKDEADKKLAAKT